MRERVAALGGTLSIDSPKGEGTRLLVRVPVKPARPLLDAAAPPASEATDDARANAA